MTASSGSGSTMKEMDNRRKITSISSSHFTRMAARGALKTLATSVLSIDSDGFVSAATAHEHICPLPVNKLEEWLEILNTKDQLRLALLQWHFDSRIPVPYCRELVEIVYGYPIEKAETYRVIWELSEFAVEGETLEEFTFALDDILGRCREQIRAQAKEDGVNETLFRATLRLLCAPESCKNSLQFIATHVFDFCLECATDKRKSLNRPVVNHWFNEMGWEEHLNTSLRVLRNGIDSIDRNDIRLRLAIVVSVGFKARIEITTDANQQKQDKEMLDDLCNRFLVLYTKAHSISAVAVREGLEILLPKLYLVR